MAQREKIFHLAYATTNVLKPEAMFRWRSPWIRLAGCAIGKLDFSFMTDWRLVYSHWQSFICWAASISWDNKSEIETCTWIGIIKSEWWQWLLLVDKTIGLVGDELASALFIWAYLSQLACGTLTRQSQAFNLLANCLATQGYILDFMMS